MDIVVANILLLLLAIGAVTATSAPTVTQTPTPPMLVYMTPAPAPTPIGLLLFSGTPTHGIPFTVNEQESGVAVLVNGNFQGLTNSAGSFIITFPSAGIYTLNVGDYPQQTLSVN